MSLTLRDRPILGGPASGGVPARRAVARWAWRLLRREWRQQFLMLALLTSAVAAVAFSSSAAYNVTSLPGPQFGSANHLLQLDGSNPRALAADIAAARKAFGTIQVIGHRSVPIPGSQLTLEFRAENPAGPFADPLIALVQGSYPVSPGQIALTSGAAQTLQAHVGGTVTLGGQRRAVTGIVQNPSLLSDQFALVAPAGAGPPQSVTVLLDATPSAFDAFRSSFQGPLVWQAKGASSQGAIAAVVLALGTVLLLLVSLVAAAGFAVIAARRQRQLGMLAAVGANRRQLRMVMVAGGALIGALAAVTGAVLGLAVWLAAASHLETFANHRIDRFNIPWYLVALGMVLATLTATGAAWQPARSASRLPITFALSARPPRPEPAHRPAILAVLLTAAGIVGLALGNQSRPLLIIIGALAMAAGLPFLAPLAVRTLALPSRHAPIAIRLALRDLARYQARAGAALATISLALGIAAAIIISAAADKTAPSLGNLPDSQMVAWIGQPASTVIPLRSPAQLKTLAAAARQIAAPLHHSAVITLEVPVDPAVQPQPGGQPSVDLAAPENQSSSGRGGAYRSIPLYVASPAVLSYLGISQGAIAPVTDYVTNQPGQLSAVAANVTAISHVQRMHTTSYGSAPGSLITEAGLHRLGWRQMIAGWLITTDQPLTAAQLSAARSVAAQAGLTVESRNTQAALASIGATATAAGALFALGVLAMTIGLIRSEAARDLRTLTAAGATSGTRRTITASTTGVLALLGALLGCAYAYFALIAGHRSNLSVLRHVPVLYLVITVAGVPAAAALISWIVAGREPPSLGRQPLD